jgi:hypothetical protein
VAYAVVRERDAGQKPTTTPCAQVERITVAASPDIAPLVAEIARGLDRPQPALDGTCLAVSVGASASPTAAQDLASGDPSAVPHVWIPDSSLWVAVARAAPGGAARLPAGDAPSIAMTPIVVAMHPGPPRSGAGRPLP